MRKGCLQLNNKDMRSNQVCGFNLAAATSHSFILNNNKWNPISPLPEIKYYFNIYSF